jgi:hypothetical protein
MPSKSLSMSIRVGNTGIGMRYHVIMSSSVNGHRGCVTPKQIGNLIESSGGDTDMVDGFDEVPAEYQEKIQFALENGHIPDEDWKGVSCLLNMASHCEPFSGIPTFSPPNSLCNFASSDYTNFRRTWR